jgi:hypothetical protein
MDLIERKLFADFSTRPSQLICLVHAGEMGFSNLLELPRIGRGLATTLESNFPGRLSRLFILDLPPSWLWLLQLMQRIIHPSTKQKLVLCGSDSPNVPSTFAPISPARRTGLRQTAPGVASPAPQEALPSSRSFPGLMPEDSMSNWAVTPSPANCAEAALRVR